MLTLPIADPLLKIALLTAAMLLAPLAAARLRLPGIVGLILAGILIGPHAFGLLERDAAIEMLGGVGLLYIMFVAGAEVDLHEFGRSRKRTALFGALTFLIPQVVGTVVGIWWLKFPWPKAVLLASMFASHTLVAYPIISGLGLARREAVVVALGGTIITDTVALLVLAVIAGMKTGGMDAALWGRLLGALALVGPGILFLVPLLGRWFFRNMGTEGGPQFLFILAVVFLCALAAEWAGLEPIIGAFLAGLALNRLIPGHSTLMNRVQFFGNYFFIPFFLISVGMLVDLKVLATSAKSWNVAGTMVVVALGTKWAAARLTRRLCGYSSEEGWLLYSLSVAQAAATMAAVLVGYRLAIFDDAVVNGTILMILVTCLAAPWLADRYGRRLAVREAAQAPPSRGGMERILVPVAHHLTAEPLVDLAIALRKGAGSTEPVHALRVVPEDDEEAGVPAAERLLGACVVRGAAADAPVNPIIRLDVNVADGVLRAVREQRITTLVIGWKGHTSARERIFGSVFDQILATCRQRILVCRIDHAVNTCRRVVLALPPLAEYDSRFTNNLRDVAFLAREFGAALEIICVAGERTQSIPARIRHQVPTTLREAKNWREARDLLDRTLGRDDLFVLFSARTGSLAWQPGLDRLPRHVAERHPDIRMIVVYPAAVGEEAPPISPAADENGALVAAAIPRIGGIRTDLAALSFEEALRELLAEHLSGRPEDAAALEQGLLDVAREYPPEIAPGVLLLHTHSDRLIETAVLLGISRGGLSFRDSPNPVRAIFIILGSQDQPASAHVRLLAAIAQLVRRPGWLDRLAKAGSADEVRAILLRPDGPNGAIL